MDYLVTTPLTTHLVETSGLEMKLSTYEMDFETKEYNPKIICISEDKSLGRALFKDGEPHPKQLKQGRMIYFVNNDESDYSRTSRISEVYRSENTYFVMTNSRHLYKLEVERGIFRVKGMKMSPSVGEVRNLNFTGHIRLISGKRPSTRRLKEGANLHLTVTGAPSFVTRDLTGVYERIR